MPEAEVRALAFFTLVLTLFSLVLVNRSFSTSLLSAFGRGNAALRWVFSGVAAMLGLSLLWSPARAMFRFGPLHPDDLTVTTARPPSSALICTKARASIVRHATRGSSVA
jgi:Ca2+-transporting ATPase